MYQQSRSPFSQMPPVTKNLIIINAIMLLATWLLRNRGIVLEEYFALFYPKSAYFRPWQFITYMFMHANITHLFFNMFALWMFGRVLENVWGPKRYLIFYFVTGLGAAALHTFVNYIEIAPMMKAITAFSNTPSADVFSAFVNKYPDLIKEAYDINQVRDFAVEWFNHPESTQFEQSALNIMNSALAVQLNIPTVGASGAVYGVLLGFGMLFPNTQLMLLIPPIPIKAKYMVIAYGALELVMAFTMPGSHVAHFAHLGGMLFGFILIKYWNTNTNSFY
jgi:membrane associated rhomboid family serine protease